MEAGLKEGFPSTAVTLLIRLNIFIVNDVMFSNQSKQQLQRRNQGPRAHSNKTLNAAVSTNFSDL